MQTPLFFIKIRDFFVTFCPIFIVYCDFIEIKNVDISMGLQRNHM
nr:MAG TPA: hypothetical protein [Caudoviricetes sp.]